MITITLNNDIKELDYAWRVIKKKVASNIINWYLHTLLNPVKEVIQIACCGVILCLAIKVLRTPIATSFIISSVYSSSFDFLCLTNTAVIIKLDNMYAIEYTINMEQRVVKIVQLSNGKIPFIEWLESLDKVTKSRVQSRLTRLLENNFGDHKKIDNEISQLRLKFGSGYRIYYTEIDNVVVLLITGGDKSTQSKDIQKAKEILQEWRNIQ